MIQEIVLVPFWGLQTIEATSPWWKMLNFASTLTSVSPIYDVYTCIMHTVMYFYLHCTGTPSMATPSPPTSATPPSQSSISISKFYNSTSTIHWMRSNVLSCIVCYTGTPSMAAPSSPTSATPPLQSPSISKFYNSTSVTCPLDTHMYSHPLHRTWYVFNGYPFSHAFNSRHSCAKHKHVVSRTQHWQLQ